MILTLKEFLLAPSRAAFPNRNQMPGTTHVEHAI